MRDFFPEFIQYHQPLLGDGRDPGWIQLKFDRLAMSPLGFFRGTFFLFVSDWWAALASELTEATTIPQPIVGDLHLENFGIYKTPSGAHRFDVNDFDETATGPRELDLCRLSVSLVLSADKHGSDRAVEYIERCLGAYEESFYFDRPAPEVAQCAAISDLFAQAEAMSRQSWLEKRVAGAQLAQRRFRVSDKLRPIGDAKRRDEVIAGVAQFAACSSERPHDCPSWPQVLDVASRVAGTGSLGRFRYVALLAGKGEKVGKELVLECKEARPSALAPGDSSAQQAERVVATQRQLLQEPPAYLGTTDIAGRPFVVRALQPSEAKLEFATLKHHDRNQVCAVLGTVLGQLHRRATRALEGPQVSPRKLVAAALRYADQVAEDHARFCRERATLMQALTTLPHNSSQKFEI